MQGDRLRRATGLPWFTGALTGLAALAVFFELAVSAVQAKQFAMVGWRVHHRPLQLSRNDDLDPLAYFLPTAALVGAQRLIPPDATYTVAFGDEPNSDLALPLIVFKMWLVPRRYTELPADAEWVIAYHRSSESLGVPYRSEIGVAPNINVVKVQR